MIFKYSRFSILFFVFFREFITDFECTNHKVSSYALRDSSRSFPSGKTFHAIDFQISYRTTKLFCIRSRFNIDVHGALSYLVPAMSNTKAPINVFRSFPAESFDDLGLFMQYQ